MTKHILVIDDDGGTRQIAQIALEAAGPWQVTTVASGKEGVALARSQSFDAILLDVMMPDQDGITTCNQIRGENQKTPVILFTAKARSHEQAALSTLDVAGIITKPFKAMDLVAQIKTLLGWS